MMNWLELQVSRPALRSLLRLPLGVRSDLSRDGDNSGVEENQEVVARLISNEGQTGEGAFGHQSVNRRNTHSSGGVEERERDRIRIWSSTWENDLEEGRGGIEERSREAPDDGNTDVTGRSGDGSTNQLVVDDSVNEHLNVSIDTMEFWKDLTICLLILSANVLVRHCMEIMYFGASMLFLYIMDRKFRAHVAQTSSVSPVTSVSMAILVVLYVVSSMHFVGKTVGLKQMWRRYLLLPLQEDEKASSAQPKGLGETIWLVCMIDFWVKHVVFAVKALVAASPDVYPYTELRNEASMLSQKRKLYAVIEATGRCYRTILPCTGWLEYYQSIPSFQGGPQALASSPLSFVSLFYLGVKCGQFFSRCKMVLDGIYIQCNGMVEFGRLATDDDLCNVSECCICHETVTKPAIVLECFHIFCEGCLQEWLDRENTCPLCRRHTRSLNPIPTSYRDGHTSLLPFFW